MPDMNQDDLDSDDGLHPGMPSYVADDASFRAAVTAGQESARRGPNRSLSEVLKTVRALLPPR